MREFKRDKRFHRDRWLVLARQICNLVLQSNRELTAFYMPRVAEEAMRAEWETRKSASLCIRPFVSSANASVCSSSISTITVGGIHPARMITLAKSLMGGRVHNKMILSHMIVWRGIWNGWSSLWRFKLWSSNFELVPKLWIPNCRQKLERFNCL